MINNELQNAVERLKFWFRLFTLEDFIEGQAVASLEDLAPTNKNILKFLPNEETPVINRLSSLLLNVQKGALTSNELLKEIQSISLQLDLSSLVKIYFEPTTPLDRASIKEIFGTLLDNGDINENTNAPTKAFPTVSVITNKTLKITPSNKYGNAISVFMNAIPTKEWARCSPYLDVKFQFQRPSLSTDNRPLTPSSVRFLNGTEPLNQDSFNIQLQNAVSIDREVELTGDANPENIGESGMEMFTMPQTLVNTRINESERINDVIDRFRPLASISKFEIDISQAAGVMSYKTGKLYFTLHDRSRLHEIADFIKAGLYNKTEMLITYGWSHPHKSNNNNESDNVFADFINALKVKEKYQISNYSIDLKQNGECDIVLNLFTKSSVDLYTSRILDTSGITSQQKFLTDLQDKIATLRKKIYKQDKKYTEEIRGQQILQNASDHKANLLLPDKLRRELKDTLGDLEKNPTKTAKQLKESLIALYGRNGNDGTASELETSYKTIKNNKLALIKGSNKTPDPFIEQNDKIKNSTGNQVSLAKLMLLFVIHPLAITNKFDDIQLIFYNLNSHAGAVRNQNLGEFIINFNKFKERFEAVAKKRKTSAWSIQEFIRFINNNFLENIANPNYGLSDLYNSIPDKETGNFSVKPKKKFTATQLQTQEENLLRGMGILDGKMKLPKIDFYMECVPALPNTEGEKTDVFEGLTVLRLHVFDSNASSFESQQAFLAAQRNDEISSLGYINTDQDLGDLSKLDKEKAQEEQKKLQDFVDQALAIDLIEPIRPLDGKGADAKTYKFKGGPQQVKDFIASTMPSMIYGANNSSVIEAGLKTMQDAALTTINMINADDKGDLDSRGGATDGLPLRIFPAQVDMRLFGCPILEFTQQIFCDFQTSTSFDNVYYATKIQHEISSGKFLTSVQLVPGDGYATYSSVVNQANNAIAILSDYENPSS